MLKQCFFGHQKTMLKINLNSSNLFYTCTGQPCLYYGLIQFMNCLFSIELNPFFLCAKIQQLFRVKFASMCQEVRYVRKYKGIIKPKSYIFCTFLHRLADRKCEDKWLYTDIEKGVLRAVRYSGLNTVLQTYKPGRSFS